MGILAVLLVVNICPTLAFYYQRMLMRLIYKYYVRANVRVFHTHKFFYRIDTIA